MGGEMGDPGDHNNRRGVKRAGGDLGQGLVSVEPRWRWFDKLGGLAILLAVLCGTFYAAVPSVLFLRPVAMQFEGHEVIFVRETPLGPVEAVWSAEISVLGRDGRDCYGSGSAYYQEVPGNQVRYKAGPWAWPCLDAGPPFAFRERWSVRLFSFIPLRPVWLTREYQVETSQG